MVKPSHTAPSLVGRLLDALAYWSCPPGCVRDAWKLAATRERAAALAPGFAAIDAHFAGETGPEVFTPATPGQVVKW